MKKLRFRMRVSVHRIRVDGSRIRKEKNPDTKILGCMWMGCQFQKGCMIIHIVLTAVSTSTSSTTSSFRKAEEFDKQARELRGESKE